MNLGTLSRKFLFSKKSHSIVNLVAIVSVIAVAVPTAAMIITLSLHNGLTSLIESVYSGFDSELRVIPRSGQYFELDSIKLVEIREFAEVSPTLESSAILKWSGRSTVVTLRGVDSSYSRVSELPSTIERGEWITAQGDSPRLVLGAGVSYNLALSLGMGKMVDLYAVSSSSRGSGSMALFESLGGGVPMVDSRKVEPAGVFTAEASVDVQYVFTDIGLVRDLTQNYSGYSSLEIKPSVELNRAKQRLEEILGDDMVVKTRREQRQTIFSTVETEKVMLYLTLLLISVIAAMSLSGCTLMMVTEKRQAAMVLRSIGLSSARVRGVFLRLSMMVVLIGVGLGFVLGLGFVGVQYYFEPLKMAGYQLLVESYPVELSLGDLVVTFFSVLLVGAAIVYLTVKVQKFK